MGREISFNAQIQSVEYSSLMKTEQDMGTDTDKATDKVGKENLNPNAKTTTKKNPSKPIGKSQSENTREALADVADKGVQSVKARISAKKSENIPEGAKEISTTTHLPSKEQMKSAVYRPFFPGAKSQDNSEVSLDKLDAFSATREMGSGTANTVGMYRTTIDGQEYFVKRVSSQVAQAAATIDDVANRLGLASHMLPTTHVENPDDPDTAFLFTPMLSEVNDVKTSVLEGALGDSTDDFLTRMAVFDHIIGNTDRSNFKQLMESGGQIYLADNDNSLETTGLEFESRTAGHVIEIFADDRESNYKEFQISPEIFAAAEEIERDLDSLVENFTDDEAKESAKNCMRKGLEGLHAIKELANPTLGDICENSSTMDRLMGYDPL